MVSSLPEPRYAGLRILRNGQDVLDQALVLWFEPGRSFTGEEVVELHLHGSPAIVAAVLGILAAVPGLRLAEPGEFTRRALENGCLDLAQVEGLSDLISSETEAQRRQAMRVFSGALGERTESWRRRLIRAGALLAAVIDFPDEDVPIDVRPEVGQLIESVLADLRLEVVGYATAERVRDGFEVAILGAPNSGKSTLLNRLAGREAAITSEIAGTTRDVIEVRMDLGGLPVTFLDTAGLRETIDPVEAIGIERAIQRAKAADLRIFLVDQAAEPLALAPGPDDIVVHSKADLCATGSGVSGLTGQGVPELIDLVQQRLASRVSAGGTIIRLRHRVAVEAAIQALESADIRVRHTESSEELAAEDLRLAVQSLDSLVGRVDVEDLLGEIFSSFCIGK
jgi:tRNA modification GTPase